MLKTLLLWTAVGMAGAAHAAPDLARHADLDLATARQLADATLKHCTGALSVLDRGGNVLMAQRPEGVGPHNLLASQRKAYTALSTNTRPACLPSVRVTTPRPPISTPLPSCCCWAAVCRFRRR